jgi:hypothetical protein
MVTLLSGDCAGPIFLLLIFNLIASQAERARDLKLARRRRRATRRRSSAFLERQQVTGLACSRDYDAQHSARRPRRRPRRRRSVSQRTSREGKPGSVRLVFDRSRDRARPSIEQAESLLRATTGCGASSA